ncbi:MAG: anthranilate synthase [Bacillariaceae sp.]|jgi:anthranilate synthase
MRLSTFYRSNCTTPMSSLRLLVLPSVVVLLVAVVVLRQPSLSQAFTTRQPSITSASSNTILKMSNSIDSDIVGNSAATIPDFNGVEVAKTGGAGMITAGQQAVTQQLSLGAPGVRPKGGHYLTKGGIQVTANVDRLDYTRTGDEASLANKKSSEAIIESLVERLDSHKGVLLTSSYEFPGRYARWSLGFVDPPLEVSGRANQCTIKALNDRGKVLLPAIERAMKEMKQQNVLSDVNVGEEQIDVTVVPPSPVGTFSEEERSRQVREV